MENAASECSTQTDEVATVMEKLGLTEDDMDDVAFDQDKKQPEAATRWMVVAKVHTETEFSHLWFFKNMRSAWDLAKEVKIRVIEDNPFSLQFSCLGESDGWWPLGVQGEERVD
jgi:hypothetical protein